MTKALLALVPALFVSAGCERGTLFDCSCSFLTDYDDPSRLTVEVCAPTPDRAPDVAKGCAQSGAPAPVQSCSCRPLGKAACEVGHCAQVAR